MQSRHRSRLWAAWLGFAGIVMLCCGCGTKLKLYPVHGKVLVDGKPAEGALVVFHPVAAEGSPALRPSGKVDKDGVFTLHTYFGEERASKAGAASGDYRVTILWLPPGTTDAQTQVMFPDLLKHRYSNAETSKLYAQVNKAPTEVPPIELKMK
jgi:hypothetical protein